VHALMPGPLQRVAYPRTRLAIWSAWLPQAAGQLQATVQTQFAPAGAKAQLISTVAAAVEQASASLQLVAAAAGKLSGQIESRLARRCRRSNRSLRPSKRSAVLRGQSLLRLTNGVVATRITRNVHEAAHFALC
jgi:hypothetical protein